MNWPSCAGWFNILGVGLNMLGVLTLFYFRFEGIGGWLSRSLPPEHPNSLQGAVDRNQRRRWKQDAGTVLIVLGWVAQVIAQLFP
jgi:hypothetical protein